MQFYINMSRGPDFGQNFLVRYDFFGKVLGEGKITDVFQIEMSNKGIVQDSKNWDGIDELSKRDGFKSSKEMFSWFDKRYDLQIPKKFWVYRFRWIK